MRLCSLNAHFSGSYSMSMSNTLRFSMLQLDSRRSCIQSDTLFIYYCDCLSVTILLGSPLGENNLGTPRVVVSWL